MQRLFKGQLLRQYAGVCLGKFCMIVGDRRCVLSIKKEKEKSKGGGFDEGALKTYRSCKAAGCPATSTHISSPFDISMQKRSDQ